MKNDPEIPESITVSGEILLRRTCPNCRGVSFIEKEESCHWCMDCLTFKSGKSDTDYGKQIRALERKHSSRRKNEPA